MAKKPDTSFNFGANAVKKASKSKGSKGSKGGKGNAWQQYVGAK